jgi:hypothetical protein
MAAQRAAEFNSHLISDLFKMQPSERKIKIRLKNNRFFKIFIKICLHFFSERGMIELSKELKLQI